MAEKSHVDNHQRKNRGPQVFKDSGVVGVKLLGRQPD